MSSNALPTALDLDAEPAPTRPATVRMSKWQWLTALVFAEVALVIVALRLMHDEQLLAYGYFALVGSVLAVSDFTTRRLPDWLTLPSYPVLFACLVFAASVFHANGSLTRAIEAAALMLAVFGAVCLATDTGLGDLKLAGLLGLVLGSRSWLCLYQGSLYGWLLAALFVVLRAAAGRGGRRLPLGTFLIGGAFVALIV